MKTRLTRRGFLSVIVTAVLAKPLAKLLPASVQPHKVIPFWEVTQRHSLWTDENYQRMMQEVWCNSTWYGTPMVLTPGVYAEIQTMVGKKATHGVALPLHQLPAHLPPEGQGRGLLPRLQDRNPARRFLR